MNIFFLIRSFLLCINLAALFRFICAFISWYFWRVKLQACQFKMATEVGLVHLLFFLKNYLGCEEAEIENRLEDDRTRQDVENFLRGRKMLTTYVTRNKTYGKVTCDSLSSRGALGTYAYQGFLNMTVEQHYYGRHEITLRYPWMRMIVQGGGISKKGRMVGQKHLKYFPIELLNMEISSAELESVFRKKLRPKFQIPPRCTCPPGWCSASSKRTIVDRSASSSSKRPPLDPKKEYMFAGNEVWEEIENKPGDFKQIWPPSKEEDEKRGGKENACEKGDIDDVSFDMSILKFLEEEVD